MGGSCCSSSCSCCSCDRGKAKLTPSLTRLRLEFDNNLKNGKYGGLAKSWVFYYTEVITATHAEREYVFAKFNDLLERVKTLKSNLVI